MAEEFNDKDVDGLLEASKSKVLDNVAMSAVLRNFNGRLKKLEAKGGPKTKAAKPSPASAGGP
jgi:hypothetical protein